MTGVVDRIERLGVVPVVVLDDPELARPLGDALAAGGLPCAEVTFRTPRAGEVLRRLAEDERLLVGAGTVLDVDQLGAALDAGAQYVVTPGYSRAVVRAGRDRGVPVIPGVATPTEIMLARDDGLSVLKFFPAEAVGGTRALAALAGPFGGFRFIPTGGVTPDNLPDYLAVPAVLAVGGSWMVSPRLIAAGRWDDISRLAAEAVAVVAGQRH